MGSKANLHISESQAWLKLLRVSNSPTIVSNIMVGVALAIQSHHEQWEHRFNPPPFHITKPLFFITIVLLLLYFSGMVLNDAFDSKRDKKLRPDRPIPQGIISVKQAWFVGLTMLVSAILISTRISTETILCTSILGMFILFYTFLHHKKLVAIPLMAICRGLVYITAITAFSTPYTFALVIFCGAIGIYTSLLTFIGSSEHDGQLKHSWLVWATLIPALIPALLFGPESPITWFTFIAFAGWIYVAWHHFVASSNNVISGMHTLLSGFALLDCLLIASLGEYYIMLTSAICFVLTIAAQRKILGT